MNIRLIIVVIIGLVMGYMTRTFGDPLIYGYLIGLIAGAILFACRQFQPEKKHVCKCKEPKATTE